MLARGVEGCRHTGRKEFPLKVAREKRSDSGTGGEQKGGRAMRNSKQHLLRSKGGSKKALFPLISKRKGPF